jgi:diguanylate cyclase (GGDEF)-like protein
MTVSIGVASEIPDDNQQGADRLLKAADERLYRAKEEGRNRVRGGQNQVA